MAKKVKPEVVADVEPLNARALKKLLGSAYPAFQTLAKSSGGKTSEWKRYSMKSPWVKKVSQGERTLYYLKPQPDFVEVTVVLGERATEAALAGRVSKSLHEAIRSAKPYAEGRPVRVPVRDKEDISAVDELVAVKLRPTGHD